MNISSRRAQHIAITGFILSVIFFVGTFVLSGFSGYYAVSALAWQILGGAFVWLVLIIVFYQRSRAEQEKLDMAQIARARHGDTIFQAHGEQGELMAVAQRRLRIMEKWFLPAFSVLIAVYQITIGFLLIGGIADTAGREYRYEALSAVLLVIAAFVGFLIGRYATGMSAQMEWKPLRAGGSYTLSVTILAFCAAVGLALAAYKMDGMIRVMEWVIPVLMIVLGFETAINTVLDIYRPRIAGQYARSAFDSRLLGMINEPGGILHTFAGAIDYQFGFKVSQTWFYKLLEEAVLPLVLFAIATLYVLSCVVVVGPGEQAVIERLGAFDRVAEPGLTFKLPWPFGVARTYPTKEIQVLTIGFEEDPEKTERKPLLWGESHYKVEDKLLVAAKRTESAQEDAPPPVSLVIAAIPVQYRIRDLKSYVYNHFDSEKVLYTVCYRELVRYLASAKVETYGDADSARQSILGAGRTKAAEHLTFQMQNEADAAGVGVEIVHVGLQGIHPPVEVTEAYQQVIAAVQKKQAAIMDAQTERNTILISLCGGVKQADELYDLATRYRHAREAEDAGAAQLGRQLNDAIAGVGGEISRTLIEAQSAAFEKVILAKATGMRFADQLKAYRAGGDIFLRQHRLAMLEETLPNARKFVVIAEDADAEVYIIDLQKSEENSLYKLNLDALEAMPNK
ncbi:MAG: hypothetical protein J7M40_11475 [Planctomycetes bacterium]|nr:hypothetical protein [Planctomycetota bacterium]